MAIVRWDPFDAFLGAQEDLNRMFRIGWLRDPGTEDSLAGGGQWSPAVDIYEAGDSLVVEAELPGIDPKDIDVTVDDGVLTVKGERRHESEVKEESYHRIERAYGLFQRSVRLPAEAEPDKIKASYDSGVLKITVPKAEPKKPKAVPVTIETKKENR
ncbi:MAG: Hsp20/alpha crystallin family protein [Candidatus Geothermincolia bacterium]